MPKFRNFQTNFSGGLLSEGMLGRLDLAQYENGCRILTNWWPKVTGGMRRRPGSVYLNSPPTGVRVESFIFSETQVYIIVFCSDNTVKVYNHDTGAQIANLIITGITLSETVINELSITQTADVMFCAHETFPTLMIRRTGASTFVQEAFEFEGVGVGNNYPKKMPFIKYEAGASTIRVNGYADGANVTVTANTAVFTARHVGTAIRYRGKQIMINSVTSPPSTTASGTILEDLDRGAVLGFNPSVDTGSDFEVDEIIVGRDSGTKGQVISTTASSITIGMIGGLFPSLSSEEIEGLTSGNVATITSNSNVNPVDSTDWDEEAFSPTQGYPSVVEFHSQRLWFAGSSSLPAHVFGSRVAAFFNFDVGDAFPADSIQVVISDKQINLITDIVSGRHLQIFTDAGEFYAPSSDDLPLVPETFDLKKQTRYGSKRAIEPKLFDESTIFVQAQGNAVREFIWIDSLRGYSSDAISLISEEHLKDVQEIQVMYGGYDRPEQLAFFVNGDGDVIWYHAARAEQIRTWGKWETEGDYKSLTVLQDKMYALVERTPTGGSPTIMLERFELYMTVDSGITKVQPGLTPVTGFINHMPHLPNTEVEVVVAVDADGAGDIGGAGSSDQALDADYYLGRIETGASGSTGLSDVINAEPVTNMTCGLAYSQTLETMPLEVKDNQGVTGGMPKRIVNADVYIASTLAVQLQGNRITTFKGPADFTVKPDAITGLRKFYLLGYDERPTLTILNDIPVPCEALSIGAEVEY